MTACSLVIQPSRILAAILAVLHASALGAALAGLAGMPLALTFGGILLSMGYLVADALGLLPSSVREVELREDGSGHWADRAGHRHSVQSTRASWVSSGLVVLGLRQGRWRTRWLVLMPDSAARESLRRLRVWLKWRPL